MHKTFRMTALAALMATAPLGTAFAERAPTADETAWISDVLLTEGYTSWGEIEFDDDQWTVQNAIGEDGIRRDLVLDSQFMVLNDGEDDSLVKLQIAN